MIQGKCWPQCNEEKHFWRLHSSYGIDFRLPSAPLPAESTNDQIHSLINHLPQNRSLIDPNVFFPPVCAFRWSDICKRARKPTLRWPETWFCQSTLSEPQWSHSRRGSRRTRIVLDQFVCRPAIFARFRGHTRDRQGPHDELHTLRNLIHQRSTIDARDSRRSPSGSCFSY